jgi:DNA-binding transcriptional LysR family regulator
MDIRALKYLLSLAERGSVTSAAKEHFVTQPAVSIALRKLEEELGQQLYRIEGRTVLFTQAGEIALEYARRLSNLETELFQRMGDLEGLRRGRISLGTIDAASIYVLPEVFSRFRERFAGIEVKLEISSTMILVEKMDAGQLDLVIGTIPVDAWNEYEIFPIYSEQLIVIAPPGHPLADGKAVSVRSLAGHPFISFHEGSITRRIVERALAGKGVTPIIAMAIDSPEAIKHLVSSGLGLAVLPRRVVRGELGKGSLAVIDVEGLRIERKLGLILRSEQYISATARAFLGVMEQVMKVGLPPRLLEQGEKIRRRGRKKSGIR